MEYTVRDILRITAVEVRGELDVREAPKLRTLLSDLIEEGRRVLVDLHDVTLIDSSGIGVLIAAHRAAQEAESALVLVAPQPAVRRALQLARADQVLRIFDTVKEGVTALYT
jgi:anti-anti-sigma factor